MKNRYQWWAGVLVAQLGVFSSLVAEARPITRHAPIDVKSRTLAPLKFANMVIRADVLDEVGVAKDEYVLSMIEELRRLGFPVLGAESLVFEKDASQGAPFSLGGTLTEIVCKEYKPNACGIVIKWELLDRRSDRVVYQVETRHEEGDLSDSFSKAEAKALFIGALQSLLSREAFVSALEEGSPAPQSTGPSYEPKTIKACSAPALNMPKDTERVLGATVVVRAGDGIGSGFLVSPDGLVLTAAHVVANNDVKVTLRDGTTHAGRTVRMDAKHDVALVQLETKQTACLATRLTPASAGEDIYAIGAPAGEAFSFSLSRGIVSGAREIDGVRFLQTDASINPGNSGGPLVDAQGNALAIVSWKLTGPNLSGLGFGVPVASALEQLALTPGDHTDGALGTVQPSKSGAKSAAYVDTPDPGWKEVNRPKPELVGWVRPVRTVSWIAVGAGAAVAAYSYTKFKGEYPLQPSTYDSMRTVNDVGWVLFGAGVAGIISSYVFQSYEQPPAKEAHNKPKVTADLGAGFASLKVVY